MPGYQTWRSQHSRLPQHLTRCLHGLLQSVDERMPPMTSSTTTWLGPDLLQFHLVRLENRSVTCVHFESHCSLHGRPVFHRATRVHELPDPLRGLDLVQMSIPGEPQSGNGVQCPHFSVTCGKVQMLVEDDDSLYVRWADDLFQDCSTTPLDTLVQDGVKSLIELDCLWIKVLVLMFSSCCAESLCRHQDGCG